MDLRRASFLFLSFVLFCGSASFGQEQSIRLPDDLAERIRRKAPHELIRDFTLYLDGLVDADFVVDYLFSDPKKVLMRDAHLALMIKRANPPLKPEEWVKVDQLQDAVLKRMAQEKEKALLRGEKREIYAAAVTGAVFAIVLGRGAVQYFSVVGESGWLWGLFNKVVLPLLVSSGLFYIGGKIGREGALALNYFLNDRPPQLLPRLDQRSPPTSLTVP